MLGELRETSRRIMDEWREGRRGRKEALKELADLRDAVGAPIQEDVKLSVRAIAQGQVLLYLPWNKTGQVLEVDGKKDRVRLNVSGVSLWVGAADVRLPEGKSQSKPASRPVLVRRESAPVAMRLDVRGLRTDEAEAELSCFLDKALLAGRTEVEIVHGMGTGAMRRAVHEHLRQSRAVSGFALANADEGGDGMTKVTLAG